MGLMEKTAVLREELQVLAFNLAARLETLNFHSSREAVEDLDRRALPLVNQMQKKIRSLVHNLEAYDSREAAGAIEDARDMYSLLDLVRKCSVESESYHNLIKGLIPLMEKLDEWGRLGPLPRDTIEL